MSAFGCVARKLRRAGKIPAVLYGQEECLLLTVKPDDLVRILKSHVASTALLGIALFAESADPLRLLFIALILAGVAGLKLVTP